MKTKQTLELRECRISVPTTDTHDLPPAYVIQAHRDRHRHIDTYEQAQARWEFDYALDPEQEVMP